MSDKKDDTKTAEPKRDDAGPVANFQAKSGITPIKERISDDKPSSGNQK